MRYYALSVITGALIASMVAVNGVLTAASGVYVATVIIHIVGLILISAVCLLKGEKPGRARGLPLPLFLGGVIGVFTTVFNNVAFGRISLSAIVALGLLGQAVTSLLIDQFGLFGMPRRAFRPVKLTGLLCMLLGSGYMLRGTQLVVAPIAMSLLAGVTVVLSRTVNARLAERSSVLVSTWYNYTVGLAFALIAFALLGRGELAGLSLSVSPIWMYTGGLLGVLVVLLSNMTVARISAFYMTLLLFAGQVLTGVLIDVAVTQAFSQANLIGGLLVAIGMAGNLWLDQRQGKAAA